MINNNSLLTFHGSRKRLFCLLFFFSLLAFHFSLPPLADAHVAVKPSEVGVASFQTFTVGVPNEKETQVVSVRLLVPPGVHHISPNVKPGWTVSTVISQEEDVTEINWNGGSIPVGQRDEFLFSAQVPASATTLSWKAYQSYADGTVVAWDQSPNDSLSEEEKEKLEKEGKGPLSTTKIIDDLKEENPAVSESKTEKVSNLPLILSIAAIAISVVALSKSRNKK